MMMALLVFFSDILCMVHFVLWCITQSADDEILVRDVLYDALISLDNAILSGAEVVQADSSYFPISVSRLVITLDAIKDVINDAR
jgi:hypothetical protein